MDVVTGRAKVTIDGSFCGGTDIIKAIAAGADLVGRMQCDALAAGGAAAIVACALRSHPYSPAVPQIRIADDARCLDQVVTHDRLPSSSFE